MDLFLCSYSSQVVASNINLPELPLVEGRPADLSFHLLEPRRQHSIALWDHHWYAPDGATSISHCRQKEHHLLRFPTLADFYVLKDASDIACHPQPDIPVDTIRHLLLDQVLPRALAHQGRLMLHASAVDLGPGLLLMIGSSGTGKSTLAGNFHQAGQSAVSDDCIWLKVGDGRFHAIPSYGGLRLWEDSMDILFSVGTETHPVAHYTSKKRVTVQGEDGLRMRDGFPVLAMLELSPPGPPSVSEITLERLTHRETFIAMLKQTFLLDVKDLGRVKEQVQFLGSLIPGLPSFRLSMPRDYELLPKVRQRILETVL